MPTAKLALPLPLPPRLPWGRSRSPRLLLPLAVVLAASGAAPAQRLSWSPRLPIAGQPVVIVLTAASDARPRERPAGEAATPSGALAAVPVTLQREITGATALGSTDTDGRLTIVAPAAGGWALRATLADGPTLVAPFTVMPPRAPAAVAAAWVASGALLALWNLTCLWRARRSRRLPA